MEKAEQTAHDILSKNLDKLHLLSKALLDKEMIDSREVDEIIGRSPGTAEEVEKPVPTPDN